MICVLVACVFILLPAPSRSLQLILFSLGLITAYVSKLWSSARVPAESVSRRQVSVLSLQAGRLGPPCRSPKTAGAARRAAHRIAVLLEPVSFRTVVTQRNRFWRRLGRGAS